MFGKGKAPRGDSAVGWAIVGVTALIPLLSRGQPPPPAPAPPKAAARSYVYSIRDPAAIDHFIADRSRVHTMVDRLILGVTGRENVPDAWRSLVAPTDVVGIKISATGGELGATHRAVVEAIVDGLLSAGIPRDNLLVWDRDVDDLRAAGYLGARNQQVFACPVRGIEPRWGYSATLTYSSSVLGKLIWGDYAFKGRPLDGDEPRPANAPAPPPAPALNPAAKAQSAALDENLSNLSHYANILSRVTKIIDVPVFADSEYVGVGGALYNVTLPNVDNWRRLVGPPQYGAVAIPELYSDPAIGGRVVLCLTDGLVAQIAGGAGFQPLYARDHATLYASRDAVALDAIVLRQLETWRKEAQLPSIAETGGHVKIAGDLGLGNFAAEKIDLRRLTP